MMKTAAYSQPKLVYWDFPEDEKYSAQYSKFLMEFEEILKSVKENSFQLDRFNEFVFAFNQSVTVGSWGLFRVFHDGKVYKANTASSSLNTALVVNIFTRAIRWPEKKILDITRAALLHDVGMLFIPQEILVKEGALTEGERTVIESHPSISYEFVKKIGESFETTQVALQHHEEWSGEGYPSRIENDKIHIWSMIIAVSLNFVARVTQRSYRSSLVGYLAQKQLMKEQTSRFHPGTVKDFIKVFGMNPPGSILLLSDGSIARVMEIISQKPMRPKVRILIDQNGTEYRNDRGALIDLSLTPKLFIVRPVNFQDLINATEIHS